jgi:hypothetical protein
MGKLISSKFFFSLTTCFVYKHIVHKKSHNLPLLHITLKKASYIQGPNDVKDGILTQSYIIQIKTHNII